MDNNRWQQVEQIVDTALSLSGNERTEYIDQACSEDTDLKASVAELLAFIEASEGYMEHPEQMQDALLNDFANQLESAEPNSSMIGEQIGAYLITDLLGHGGMGSVFLAERADGQFKHKVALKLVRRGMDTPENIARFERERSILANLNHPNIARMYDGGLTDDGLPYLIMEYVDGVPIDTYCRQQDLSLEKRLELFKIVCKAVQHAHNNLVIHRDLKPANILVDQKNGVVKVLDFGIAKLLDEQPDRTIFRTRAGSQILTLAYAAPEQLTDDPVTTATDNYALGVLLHQLLTESHPFDFGDKSVTEIEEIIKHRSPARPSSNTKKWTAAIKGDLDAIILKALRKETEARYNSAGEVLEDLKRYEHKLPVSAHDDTLRYNLSKFINRHRTVLSTAVIILLLITGFGIFYTYRITEERNQARIQAEKAQQISNFVLQLFEANDPSQNQGADLPVRTILEKGAQNIEQLKGQPEIKSKMYSVLGGIYRKLGEPKKALPLLTKSNELANRTLQTSSSAKADILSNLGLVKDEVGNYAEAESLFVEADEIYSQSLERPSIMQAVNLTNLAELYTDMSKFEKAEEAQLSALDMLSQSSSEDKDATAHALNQLALIYKRQGNTKFAERYYKQSLTMQRRMHSEPYPDIATNLHNMGVLYYEEGLYDSSRVYLQQALKQRRKLYGDHHPLVASTLNGLGILDNATGKYDEASRYLSEALDILRHHYGRDHMRVALNMMNLAVVLKNKERFDQAISYLKEARSITRDLLGNENFYTAVVDNNLGKTYQQAGRDDSARVAYNQALTLFDTISPDHQRAGAAHSGLGKIYLKKLNYDSAEDHLHKAVKIYASAFDSSSQRLAATRVLLGKTLFHLQRYDEAEDALTTGKAMLSTSLESNERLLAEADSLLHRIRLSQ